MPGLFLWMKIKSLGRKTDLIFARFAGEVISYESFTVVKTPTNPGYHWGNFIIFDHAPTSGDLVKCLFDQSFSYYKEPHHYSFTWDTLNAEKGEFEEFEDAGFEFDSGVILTTGKLNPPTFLNEDVIIKKITTEHEWEEVINLQVKCADEKFKNDYYVDFKRAQFENYKRMTKEKMGNWFGAYVGDQLVADLGIYFEDKIARYQSVGTDPDFRRRGICGTLVFKAGLIALEEYNIETLVMEADPEYHAARIYESVGFKKSEINHALSWWRNK